MEPTVRWQTFNFQLANWAMAKFGSYSTNSRKNHLVASSPFYDCALMIAALMNFDLVQAIQYRDNLLRTTRP